MGKHSAPTCELIELEEIASSLRTSNRLEVPASAGLYQHALVNPCPRFLQNDALRGKCSMAGTASTLDEAGELLRADAYIGFGTVPLFANALAELTAAVRS